MRRVYFTGLLLLGLSVGCTKPVAVDPEIEKLEKKLESLNSELQKLESAISNAENDPALKAKLQEDQKLAESRKERLDFQLQKRRPTPPAGSEHGSSEHGGGEHH